MTQTTARMKKGGKSFEIIVDLDKALKFKKGESSGNFLEANNIFSDSKKGFAAPSKDMEEAFGTYVGDGTRKSLSMLTQQDRPFRVYEQWRFPDDQGGSTEKTLYRGCWFSNIGKNYRSDGDRIVNVNATLEYTRRIITNA